MSDDPENVIELFPEVKGPPVLTRGQNYRVCKHRKIEIDVEDRIIECSTCGAAVDAIEWLVRNTQAWRNANADYKATKDEVRRLERDQASLKREVKNLKAQEKRWLSKLAALHREHTVEEQLPASIELARSRQKGDG